MGDLNYICDFLCYFFFKSRFNKREIYAKRLPFLIVSEMESISVTSPASCPHYDQKQNKYNVLTGVYNYAKCNLSMSLFVLCKILITNDFHLYHIYFLSREENNRLKQKR